MALQVGNAACDLGAVSNRDAFEGFYNIFFPHMFIIAALKICSYRIVAGMSCLFFFVTGIVAGMGSPTFVADHGFV